MQRMSFKKIIPIFFLLSFFVPAFTSVSAQDYSLIPCSGVADVSDTGTSNGKECTFQDVIALAQAVAKKLVQIGLIVSPIIFAYAGYLLVTSQGNTGQRDKAKKIGWNVVKGLVVMLLAWLFVDLILRALLSQTFYDAIPWGK